MAERRMISKKITDTDVFLDMPLSSQALYFHFIQNADDDGFVASPNSILRKIGANRNDYDVLVAKKFIIQFENGICVIKHWRIHNYIQSDRYIPTTYQEQLKELELKENKSYTLKNEQCIQNVSNVYPQYSIDKDRLDKISIDNNIAHNNTVESEPALYKLQLNDNSYFEVTQSFYDELKPLYPAVNLDNEFRKMISWIIGNPAKRKTRRGIKKFITNWLSGEQDKGGNKTYQKPAEEKPKFIQHEYSSEELNNLYDDLDNISVV